MKVCHKCGELKELSEFGPHSGSRPTPDGLRYRCRACLRDYDRAWGASYKLRMAAWLAAEGLEARSPGTIVARKFHRRARRDRGNCIDPA
jgi:hypothetical protein